MRCGRICRRGMGGGIGSWGNAMVVQWQDPGGEPYGEALAREVLALQTAFVRRCTALSMPEFEGLLVMVATFVQMGLQLDLVAGRRPGTFRTLFLKEFTAQADDAIARVRRGEIWYETATGTVRYDGPP